MKCPIPQPHVPSRSQHGPRFLLHGSRATEAHRGTLSYVRAHVSERYGSPQEARYDQPKS